MPSTACGTTRPASPDRVRVWQQGVHGLVIVRCRALHPCRVPVTPWQPMISSGYTYWVVSQKWRSAEIDVTLGLVLRVSQRKECPMTTCIAVRCPHCQKDQVAKRGTTARGTQRYLCRNTICAKNSFLLAYHNRGC